MTNVQILFRFAQSKTFINDGDGIGSPDPAIPIRIEVFVSERLLSGRSLHGRCFSCGSLNCGSGFGLLCATAASGLLCLLGC